MQIDLVVIGLLYMAYPDGCQHKLNLPAFTYSMQIDLVVIGLLYMAYPNGCRHKQNLPAFTHRPQRPRSSFSAHSCMMRQPSYREVNKQGPAAKWHCNVLAMLAM